ncbi:MAG: TetR/AcrR family transcriptional regulator [Proteobacteria bacterium]|nr:TetR/AcrR family transcriptional regulator [Pseudomonadota bacterium]
MRYSEAHKQETHQRLLNLAAKALREKGPDHLSVADVMKSAGLTHGGFYAHFKSKDAFLAETLQTIFDQASERMRRMVDGMPPRHALATYIDFYVSPAHRDGLARGCPVVALNSDLPRQSKQFRAAFDAGVQRMVRFLAAWVATTSAEEPEKLAASLLSAMAGAVALSRAVSDRKLSDDLLEATRSGIKARLGLDDAALSRAARQ